MASDYPTWQHRWITPKARCAPSETHGVGVIAEGPIEPKEVVAVLGGVVVPIEEIEKYRRIVGHVGIQVDKRFFLCPTCRDELERTGVFNHSCDPNVGYAGAIRLVAITRIAPGDELVFDYAFSESAGFDQFDCRCGVPSCRGIVTCNDWRRKDIWRKYGQFYSPYLQEAIRKQTDSW